MPEGPEVTLVTYYLKSLIEGNKLISIYTDISKYNISLLRSNMIIKNIYNKGKYIFVKLVDEYGSLYIYNHLIMTGKWTTNSNSDHIRLTMYTDKITIYFDDVRLWGKFEILNDQSYNDKYNEIGPDLLNQYVSLDTYYQKIKEVANRSNMQIGKFVMEQKYFSGIGNYLKAEILYNAKISPLRKLKNLSDFDIQTLYYVSIYIIRYAYYCGGMTISNFTNPFTNSSGSFNAYIYNKLQDPCGNKVEKITQAGRTTHWVPAIQK